MKAYQQSLTIREQLVKADPSNTEWQRSLAVCHGEMGILLVEHGDPALALEALRNGRQIILRLQAQLPANAQLANDLAMFEGGIAIVQPARPPEGGLPPKSAPNQR
jgi:hypothetical protein